MLYIFGVVLPTYSKSSIHLQAGKVKRIQSRVTHTRVAFLGFPFSLCTITRVRSLFSYLVRLVEVSK